MQKIKWTWPITKKQEDDSAAPDTLNSGQFPGTEDTGKEGHSTGFNPRLWLAKAGTKNLLLMVGLVLLLFCLSGLQLGNDKDEQEEKNVTSMADCAINEGAEVSDMLFTVSDFYFSDELIGDDDQKCTPAAGNTFCCVKIYAKNMGKEASSLGKSSVWASSNRFAYTLIYDDGYEYTSYVHEKNEFLLENHTDDIIPLQSVEGYVCFEVPKEVNTSNGPLGVSISADSESCLWLIRGDVN